MAPSLAVRFTPRAEHELTGAFEWYETQRAGLGVEFLEAVDEIVALLRTSPELGRRVSGPIRRQVVRRFPYGVFYGIDGEALVIVAVIHAHRHPRRWPTTLKG